MDTPTQRTRGARWFWLPCACALFAVACGDDPASPPAQDAATDATDAAAADAPQAVAGPQVQTSCGPVVGTRPLEGVRAFLGIPYAATTAGDNRFRPPQPPACWTTPRDATRFGDVCTQRAQTTFAVPGPRSEDCLSVNVWTPDPAPASPAPVMVFIYGGGYILGGATQRLYDGAQLAAQGVVAVTLNYRVGAMGWLAHPSLTAESPQRASGNYGLLDQIAALQWVRREIAAFGGDPARVTIFGESAGAWSVCALMGSPLADGLFHRAIVQSGSCVSQSAFAPGSPIPLAEAERRGTAIAATLGCSGADTAACLRRKPADEIHAMQPAFNAVTGEFPYQAVVEGHALPRSTGERLADPSYTPPPILVGSNRDEFTIFTAAERVDDEAAYRAAVTAAAGRFAPALLAAYPVRDYASPRDALNAVLRDVVFTCPSRALARAAAVRQPATFLYQFSHANAGPAALQWGATHAGEIPYVFGNFAPPFTPPTNTDRSVLAAMQGWWTRFAAAGDPNAAGATAWPRFTTAGDSRMEIAATSAPATGLRTAQCDVIDGLR